MDRQGNVLEENHPEPREAIRADTAFVMTNLLRGVVQRGTGAAASSLDWPLAVKTGTMDEYTDAWFIGFDPDITIGVWLGYDEKKSLGNGETGATAALPIWIEVMKAYLAKRGRENPPSFQAPGNIVFVSVDKSTGAPSNGDDTITDAFIAGTQPEGAAARPRSRSTRDSPRSRGDSSPRRHGEHGDPVFRYSKRQEITPWARRRAFSPAWVAASCDTPSPAFRCARDARSCPSRASRAFRDASRSRAR